MLAGNGDFANNVSWKPMRPYGCLNCIPDKKRRTLDWQETLVNSVFFSVHEGIRTSDPTLRRRVLYPAELHGHI